MCLDLLTTATAFTPSSTGYRLNECTIWVTWITHHNVYSSVPAMTLHHFEPSLLDPIGFSEVSPVHEPLRYIANAPGASVCPAISISASGLLKGGSLKVMMNAKTRLSVSWLFVSLLLSTDSYISTKQGIPICAGPKFIKMATAGGYPLVCPLTHLSVDRSRSSAYDGQ